MDVTNAISRRVRNINELTQRRRDAEKKNAINYFAPLRLCVSHSSLDYQRSAIDMGD